MMYRMTYLIPAPPEGVCDQESIVVLAADAEDGLAVASDLRRFSKPLPSGVSAPPRWMDSGNYAAPDALSESALRYYAERLGFDLVRKEDQPDDPSRPLATPTFVIEIFRKVGEYHWEIVESYRSLQEARGAFNRLVFNRPGDRWRLRKIQEFAQHPANFAVNANLPPQKSAKEALSDDHSGN